MRDKETNKPLVWDLVDNCPKVHNDPSVTRVEYEDEAHEVALTGTYNVDGDGVPPVLRAAQGARQEVHAGVRREDHLGPGRDRQPHRQGVRRGGRDRLHGHHPDRQGPKKIPKRPVATHFFRGSQGHTNSGWTCLSIDMVNHMVGAADTWGGAFGLGAAVGSGYEGTGKPYQIPYPCPDGLLVAKAWVYDHMPYPMREPKPPTRLDLHDMFPTSIYNAFTITEPALVRDAGAFQDPLQART